MKFGQVEVPSGIAFSIPSIPLETLDLLHANKINRPLEIDIDSVR